jgi:hypothetical protein
MKTIIYVMVIITTGEKYLNYLQHNFVAKS